MKVLFVVFLFVIAAGFFAFNFSLGVFGDLLVWPEKQAALEELVAREMPDASQSLEEPEKEISTPAPLRGLLAPTPSVALSTEGVFQWTNVQRQEAQLPLLRRSAFLDEIALAKVEDMFARQYFAHISPLGVGIGDMVQSFDYEFIAIGENLALGNYTSDQALVQAWMDSPGHRANILGPRYDEIGIALRRGVFEGNSTWLAVQVLARPLSACDVPSESLRALIELKKVQVEELALQLTQKRQEIEAHRPKFSPSYNQKVAEYNELVEQYNTMVASLQADIEAYNLQVQTFNECANS